MARIGMRKAVTLATVATLGLLVTACNTETGGGGNGDGLSGAIRIDGSSTVFPVSEAVAEEFSGESPGVQVRVGQSGTGGGFEKFCRGAIDISDASRPIEDDEKEACSKKGIEYTELKVAIDGLSVVVHEDNDFAECLTVDELKKIWEPNSTVKTWKDIRSEFPADEIKLYGPGPDSGTFDYFTDEVVGEEGASRDDYTPSEDDNVLVQGVSGDENALGYFGYAYYVPNTDKLKALGVDGGDGCIEPTEETIEGGEYTPLSRPLYIYVSNASLEKEHVSAFAQFYVENVGDLLADVGYIALPEEDLQASQNALDEAVGDTGVRDGRHVGAR